MNGEWGQVNVVFKVSHVWTYLAVQWLRLHASNAGGPCSIPGQGTKVPCGVAKKKTTKTKQCIPCD